MAAHEDQTPDLPAESHESLPLKKIPTVSAKAVLKKSKALMYNEAQLQQLHRTALNSLLQAFAAEKSINSDKRNQIKERLMKEWKMTENDLCQQQRDGDLPKFDTNTITETQPLETNVEEEMLPITAEKEAKILNSDVTSNDNDFNEFIIEEYDAEKNVHRLEIADVDNMEEDGPFGWILI